MPARRSQTISEVLGPYIWPRSTPWSCRYRGTPLLTEQLLLWMNYAGLCLIQYKAEQETMHTFRTWDLGPLRGGPIIPSYNLIQVESSCSLPGPEELSQTQTSGAGASTDHISVSRLFCLCLPRQLKDCVPQSESGFARYTGIFV